MYIDICGLFGLSQMSFCHPVNGPLWPTIMALDLALSDQVVFKTDIDACKKASADFARFSRGMLNHCVCAVDSKSSSNTYLLFVCSNSLTHLSINPTAASHRSSYTYTMPNTTQNASIRTPSLISLHL